MAVNYSSKTRNTDTGTQTAVKMKKVQTQTASNKNEITTNANNVKLNNEIFDLKAQLERKTKQYNNDVLKFNVRVNELEQLLDKKEAEHSSEVILHLSKISELETNLREAEENDKVIKTEMKYRADKLDEYEKELKQLKDTVAILEDQRYGNSAHMEQKIVTMEDKTEQTLQCLRDLSISLKLNDNKNRTNETKAPSSMEGLVKMLQKSDELCQHLQEQNVKLLSTCHTSSQQIYGLKFLLYKTVITHYNLTLFVAKMFEENVNGLRMDLRTVLSRLTNETKPPVSACLLEMQKFDFESCKYREIIVELQKYRLRLDGAFASSNVILNIESVPELNSLLCFPVSILHVSYLPMLDALRYENQMNLYQMQMTIPPLRYPPLVNNHQLPQITNYVVENSPVTIRDISNQQTAIRSDSIKSESSKSSSTVSTSAQVLQEDSQNNEHHPQPKFKPFKLSLKSKSFTPLNSNVFDRTCTTTPADAQEDCTSEESHNSSVVLPATISNKQLAPFVKYSTARETTATSSRIKTEPIALLNDIKTEGNGEEEPKRLKETDDLPPPSSSTPTLPDYLKRDNTRHFKPIYKDNGVDGTKAESVLAVDLEEEARNPTRTMSSPCNNNTGNSQSRMEDYDGADVSVMERLGGKNSLVKLFFFLRESPKVSSMKVADEALVTALLAVKRGHKLTGLKKGEILNLTIDLIKKDKETNSVNICVICFGEEPTNTLPCNHAFHHTCLEKWFKIDNICPVCRSLVVTLDDLS